MEKNNNLNEAFLEVLAESPLFRLTTFVQTVRS